MQTPTAMSMSLWTRRGLAVTRRLAATSPLGLLSRRAGASVARLSTDAKAEAPADAKAEADVKADAKADAPAASEAPAKHGRRSGLRFPKMEDFLSAGQEALVNSPLDASSDNEVLATGPQPGKRMRAAVMYRLYNTTLAGALRPEQDLSVQNLHLMRLASLRALMRTYKSREAHKRKYDQRPVRVDFKPVKGTKGEKVFDASKDAWIADYLKQMQGDLERSQSPWAVGKREDFLRTANKVLHKHFNNKSITAFAQGRPLPPPHIVRNAQSRAAAAAAANAQAVDL